MKFHQLLRAELDDLEESGIIGANSLVDGLGGGKRQKALQNLYAKAFRRALRRARGRGRRAFI